MDKKHNIIMEKLKWNIIPAEIKNDNFYYSIIKLISNDKNINNIIEIGASSGEGSTEAIMIGYLQNLKWNKDNNMNIYSVEVCTERYAKLENKYQNYKNFHPYNISSINIEQFAAKENIIEFYNTIPTTLNNYSLDMILGWYDNDLKYIIKNDIPQNGINKIKMENNITDFDIALIDGSEFTGLAELDLLYGSKYILLDDINAFKNYYSHQKLKASPEYKCIIEDYKTRNGFSIFVKT
jgi:hypothetical protein